MQGTSATAPQLGAPAESFVEDQEINDDDMKDDVENMKDKMDFYATGDDGQVIKLHQRIASIPISLGGQAFQAQLEESIKDYDDDEIIALAPFEIIGRGIAGIDEMRTVLDDSRVFFGLLQIQVGEGTFARYKNIFVHFQGDKVKMMQRVKANKKLLAAKDIIEHTHAPLVINHQTQCTVDFIFNELKRVFVSDNIAQYQGKGKTTDLNTIKINYQKRMLQAAKDAAEERKNLIEKKLQLEKEAKERALEEEKRLIQELRLEAARKKLEMELEKKRLAEIEMERRRKEKEEQERLRKLDEAKNGKKKKKKKKRRKKKKDDWSNNRPWTSQRVLNAVHADISPFNWCLFAPSTKEVKAVKWGHGSIIELRKELKDDCVYYGIMRLSFGAARFRRSHWIFFLWSPDTMTSIHKKNQKRMKHVSFRGKMEELLKPFTLSLTAESLEKVTISEWLMRVKKTVVVDGDDDIFSEEAMAKAMAAEDKMIAEFKKRDEEVAKKAAEEEEARKIALIEQEKNQRMENAEKDQSHFVVQLKNVSSSAKSEMQEKAEKDKEEKEQKEQKETQKKNENEFVMNDDYDNDGSNDDDEYESDEEREPTPEPEIELTAEEIAVLEEERKRKEKEELAKNTERELKYRLVLQSKLVLESVELCKRTSEKLSWIIFAPRDGV